LSQSRISIESKEFHSHRGPFRRYGKHEGERRKMSLMRERERMEESREVRGVGKRAKE